MNLNTYQERPRKGGGYEATVDGENWLPLLPCGFTGPNAQKSHDRLKTQTRRLPQRQPPTPPATVLQMAAALARAKFFEGWFFWMQEPWRTDRLLDRVKPTQLSDDAPIWYHDEPQEKHAMMRPGKLRPGRFMTLRQARRSRFMVTQTRFQQVNVITGADIRAEGMTQAEYENAPGDFAWWRDCWNTIHNADGTRLDDGPFVFAYNYLRVR